MDTTTQAYARGKIAKALVVFIIILSAFFFIRFLQAIKDYHYSSRAAGASSQISVSGTGEAFIVPDIAEVTFSITKEAKTVKEAQDFINQKTTAALDFLHGKGLADKDIKTTSDSFSPQYDYSKTNCYGCSGNPTIRGYQAERSFSVKVRDVDSVSQISQGLGDLAVSNLAGPNFTVDDDTAVQNDARGKAIAEADAKAKILAKQLHVKLVRIVNFSESNNGGGPIFYAKDVALERAQTSAAAPTLPTGENKYTSNVTITYEIR
jgi:uncharacterized protein YggE